MSALCSWNVLNFGRKHQMFNKAHVETSIKTIMEALYIEVLFSSGHYDDTTSNF